MHNVISRGGIICPSPSFCPFHIPCFVTPEILTDSVSIKSSHNRSLFISVSLLKAVKTLPAFIIGNTRLFTTTAVIIHRQIPVKTACPDRTGRINIIAIQLLHCCRRPYFNTGIRKFCSYIRNIYRTGICEIKISFIPVLCFHKCKIIQFFSRNIHAKS